MILVRPADEGQVHACNPTIDGDGHIGAVGHQTIDEDRQGVAGRTAGRVFGRTGELGNGLSVAGAGLEHHGPPAAAARLQIDHHPDPVAQRVLAEEGARAVQVQFFGVGQQNDQGPVRRTPRLDRLHGFQNGGHARGVVGGAGRSRHAVVMGHHQDGGQFRATSGQNPDQIDGQQPRSIVAALFDAADGGGRQGTGLQAGRQAQVGQPAQQIGLHPGMFDGADGVGRTGDMPHVRHGADGGKLSGGRQGGSGFGRLTGQNRQTKGGCQGR